MHNPIQMVEEEEEEMEPTPQDTQKVVKKTRFKVKARKGQYEKLASSASQDSSSIYSSHQLEITKSMWFSPLSSKSSPAIGVFPHVDFQGESNFSQLIILHYYSC